MATAARTYAPRLYVPASAYTCDGSPKMPAPTTELMTSATRSQRRRSRTSGSTLWEILVVLNADVLEGALRPRDGGGLRVAAEQVGLQRTERSQAGRGPRLMIRQLQDRVDSRRQRAGKRQHGNDAADVPPAARQFRRSAPRRRLCGSRRDRAAPKCIAGQRCRDGAAQQPNQQERAADPAIAASGTAYLLDGLANMFTQPLTIGLESVDTGHGTTPRGNARLFRRTLIGERQPQRDAILVANHARDVSLSCEILGQLDVPWLERDLLAPRDLNLAASAQRDHVLTLGRCMPVLHRARFSAMQLGARDLHQLLDVAAAIHGELRFDVLGVGLIVGTGKHPRHEHGLARLRGCDVVSGGQAGHVTERTNDHDHRPSVYGFHVPLLSTMASASISTSIYGLTNPLTPIIAVAGRMSPNTSPCARPTCSQCAAMSTTYMRVRTTWRIDAPAFASAAAMLLSAC